MLPGVEFRCTYSYPEVTGVEAKCLCLATIAPWYVSNRQIHEDLGDPLFADRIRALTASIDSKLPNVGNPVLRQLGR